MVHRIQNRNPGYSDFPSTNNVNAFNFSETNINNAMSGANALKLDNEIVTEKSVNNETISDLNNQYNEEILSQQNETVSDNQDNNIAKEEENKVSNGLENFGLDEETTPELFNESNTELDEKEEFISFETDKENSEDEDELEIPAFLRRQKN